MAAPSFNLDAPDEGAPPDSGMPPMDAASSDPRLAAAKALMSALKSNDPAKFADAFEEMMTNIDGADEEGDLPVDEAGDIREGSADSMPF